MGSAADLITAAKNQKGIGSDAMLAKKLGVQRSLISGWRSGAVPMPDERILELADMANVDPVHWVIAIKAEQGGPRMGPLWRTALQRICAAALILAIVSPAALASGLTSIMSNRTGRKRRSYAVCASSLAAMSCT